MEAVDTGAEFLLRSFHGAKKLSALDPALNNPLYLMIDGLHHKLFVVEMCVVYGSAMIHHKRKTGCNTWCWTSQFTVRMLQHLTIGHVTMGHVPGPEGVQNREA